MVVGNKIDLLEDKPDAREVIFRKMVLSFRCHATPVFKFVRDWVIPSIRSSALINYLEKDICFAMTLFTNFVLLHDLFSHNWWTNFHKLRLIYSTESVFFLLLLLFCCSPSVYLIKLTLNNSGNRFAFSFGVNTVNYVIDGRYRENKILFEKLMTISQSHFRDSVTLS